jgi:hemoglobin/transferrin/lactoferrin receptor protein
VATKTAQPTFNVPGMAETINADDASLDSATTLSDLFLNTPSVQFQGTGRRNGQVPSIRGFTSDSILVQFDGVRQNYQSGHDGRFFIDPSLVKQVEVVRGPSSSLYGSGALGGVIALQTLQAEDLLAPGETTGAEISANYGSVNNDFTETVKAAGRYQNFDILAALTKADSGDIELGDGNELNADDDLWSGILNANWYANDYQTINFGFNGYSLDAEEPNNPQAGLDDDVGGDNVDKNTDSYTARLKYSFENPDHAFLNNFSAQAYYTNTDVEETIIVDTALSDPGDVIFRELETYGINLDNQTFLSGFGDHILSYGAEYYKDEQDGGDSGNANGQGDAIPDAEADVFGLYLQDEITLSELGKLPGELTVIPGLRFDHYESEDRIGNSQEESQLSPKIATSYRPVKWLNLFGSYSEAFRAPNLTEIYSTGTHFAIPTIPPFVLGGTNSFIPNPDLRPESTETFEIGAGVEFENVLQEGDKFQLKGSRYFIDAEDFIDLEVLGATPGPGCCGTSQNVNIPNAELDGWDIEVGYDTVNWGASLGYVETDGRNEDTGEFLTNVVPPTLTANLEYKMPERGFTAGWRSRFAKEHDDVNDSDDARDGYGVHDVYARWNPQDLQNLTLNAGVDNIFDKDYETVFAGSPNPGVNFKFGASWKF